MGSKNLLFCRSLLAYPSNQIGYSLSFSTCERLLRSVDDKRERLNEHLIRMRNLDREKRRYVLEKVLIELFRVSRTYIGVIKEFIGL